MAGELDEAPGLLGRLRLDPVELLLEPVEVTAQPSAAQERQAAQAAQALTEMSFVFTGHC